MKRKMKKKLPQKPKAPQKPKQKPTYDLEDYKDLAIRMNEEMCLEPEINEDTPDIDEMLAVIKENCFEDGKCCVFTTDNFSEIHLKMLKNLGVEPVVADEAEPENKPEPESKPEKNEPKSKPKPKPKPQPRQQEQEQDPEPDPENDEPEPENNKPKPKKSKTRYGRIDALVHVWNSGIRNETKLTRLANDKYIENGGKDNEKEQKWYTNVTIKILEGMEFATSVDGTLRINSKHFK